MPDKQAKNSSLLDSIRAALESDERSLRQIAELAETSHGQLSRFLRGERTIGLDVLDRLASVLGIVVKQPRKRPQK